MRACSFSGSKCIGQPLVGVVDDPLQHLGSLATEDHGRPRPLRGLRPRPDAVEVDELAVEAGLVVGPDGPHRLHALGHQREAAALVGAVVVHLLEVPAGADAEQEAPGRELVEGRHRLRQHDRVVFDDQRDGGADVERGGGRGGAHQRDEGVVGVRVLAGQLAARGVRRDAGRGDVGVLGEEQRLEAALLGRVRQLGRGDGVLGGEEGEAVPHGARLRGVSMDLQARWDVRREPRASHLPGGTRSTTLQTTAALRTVGPDLRRRPGSKPWTRT